VTIINFVDDTTLGVPFFYETQRQIYQGSATGTPLATITTCYNGNYAACSGVTSSVLPIKQTDVYTQLGSGQNRLSEVQYNTTGLDDKEYDYGVALGAAPSASLLVRETATSYGSYSGSTCTPLSNGMTVPCQVLVYDWSSGSQVKLKSTSYTYDQGTPTQTTGTPQHTSISGARGNLTTLATQANASTTLYQTYTYFDTGNLQTVSQLGTTSTGLAAMYTYNYPNSTSTCGNAFPTSVTEPLSLSRSYSWNCIGGVMLTAGDENGKTVTSDYTTDASFWRPDWTQDQLLNTTNFTYAGQTTTESALTFNSQNSVSDLRTTVEGFGRPSLSQRGQTPSLAEYDSTETDYNIMGQASRLTMPFQAAAGATNSTAPSTTTTYDALGRPLTVTDGGGGTITYQYIQNDMLQTLGPAPTNEHTKVKQFEYDGLGRLASVCEVTPGTSPWLGGTCGQSNSKTGYWTKYTYDALGNLLAVTQNAQSTSNQQTRTYTYDMLSRLKTESNPESSTTTYSYDTYSGVTTSPGDLLAAVKNNGDGSYFYYDALHRVTDVGWSGPDAYYCKRFRYDNTNGVLGSKPTGVTVTNTLARLAEAETDNCTGYGTAAGVITDEWYGYDADGHLTDVYESTPHSAGYYHSQASYWANGAVNALIALTASSTAIFPTIYYGASNGAGLDGEGRFTKVNAASGTNPVTGVTYVASGTSEPIGALTKVTLGTADNDNFTFDPNTGRLETYSFAVNGVNDKGTLTWNADGTLQKLVIADSLSSTTDSQTCNFLYDDLGRVGLEPGLTGPPTNYADNCSTPWQQNFTYDPFGNITKAGSGAFSPTYSTATNQYTAIPGVSAPYYDGNGNLIKDNLNTYTWDVFGNPARINTTNLIYDANGLMVEQQNGSANTQILYGPAGKTAIMNGQTLVKAFVNLPGGGMAIYNSSSGSPAYYRHADWLGSARLTSTAARGVYSDLAYAPFGEQYTTTGTADPSFTGQNADTVSTLYDFPFREHSPTQGRWISPDPAGMAAVNPMNPQTWNRYAYVMDDPLLFFDPLGLCGEPGYGYYSGGVLVIVTFASCPNPDANPGYSPCPGQGYAIVGGYLICGPPANLSFLTSQAQLALGATNNNGVTATISAGPPDYKKNYCSDQANQAALEALLPGITHGNYAPTIRHVSMDVGAHLALDAMAGSTAIKYAIRSNTDIAMSTSSKIFGGVAGLLMLYSGYDALKAAQEETKACME
jgi:RHS repeat-associated protein